MLLPSWFPLGAQSLFCSHYRLGYSHSSLYLSLTVVKWQSSYSTFLSVVIGSLIVAGPRLNQLSGRSMPQQRKIDLQGPRCKDVFFGGGGMYKRACGGGWEGQGTQEQALSNQRFLRLHHVSRIEIISDQTTLLLKGNFANSKGRNQNISPCFLNCVSEFDTVFKIRYNIEVTAHVQTYTLEVKGASKIYEPHQEPFHASSHTQTYEGTVSGLTISQFQANILQSGTLWKVCSTWIPYKRLVLLVLNPFLAPEVKLLSKSSNRLHWSIHSSSDNHECQNYRGRHRRKPGAHLTLHRNLFKWIKKEDGNRVHTKVCKEQPTQDQAMLSSATLSLLEEGR